MKNNILISIILFIIFYDIYTLYYKNIKKIFSTKNINDTKEKINSELKDNKIINSVINQFKQTENFKQNNDELDSYLIKQFGKPTYIKKNKFMTWENINAIWSNIIYKYDEEYPYLFFIKINIPSLNDYENWKKIITNIEFDPKTSNLIIPTKDEETALSIANLIILNFKGELSLDDIFNKNLLSVSIYKSKNYELVKNKMKEEIINNLSNNINKNTHSSSDYQVDLANNNLANNNLTNNNFETPSLPNIPTNLNDEIINSNVDNQFIAWEGLEYSFI